MSINFGDKVKQIGLTVYNARWIEVGGIKKMGKLRERRGARYCLVLIHDGAISISERESKKPRWSDGGFETK